MKLAFSSEENKGLKSELSHHFGRCPYYTVVSVNDSKEVEKVENIENPYFNGHGPGVVPKFIASLGVDTMVSGGMGQRAAEFFSQYGVAVITGASGLVEDVLHQVLDGSLSGYAPCTDSQEH